MEGPVTRTELRFIGPPEQWEELPDLQLEVSAVRA